MKLNNLIKVLLIGMFFIGSGCASSQSSVPIKLQPSQTVITYKDTTFYNLTGKINEPTYQRVLNLRHFMVISKIKKLHIFICSPGGGAVHMFGIFDILYDLKENYGVKITTEAHGYVASAAIPLYLIGSLRYASPTTTFMLHPHSGDDKTCPEENQSLCRIYKSWTQRYSSFLVNRTNITPEQANKWLTGCELTNINNFSAQEALELGIVTELRGPSWNE